VSNESAERARSGNLPGRLRLLRKPWEVVVVSMSVVACLALAMAILVPDRFCTIGCDPERQAPQAASSQLISLRGAIDLYLFEYPNLPQDLSALAVPSTKSGEPYVEKIPLDPWGVAYSYRILDAEKQEYEIRSAGPDHRFGTDDDVVAPDNRKR